MERSVSTISRVRRTQHGVGFVWDECGDGEGSVASINIPFPIGKGFQEQDSWENPTPGDRGRCHRAEGGEAVRFVAHNVFTDVGDYTINKGTSGTITTNRAKACSAS